MKLNIIDASESEIRDFVSQLIAANTDKVEIELSGIPWMFLSTSNRMFYFTKGSAQQYTDNRRKFDECVLDDVSLVKYDDYFVHLVDPKTGDALLQAHQIESALTSYQAAIKIFGMDVLPKIMQKSILVREIEYEAASEFNRHTFFKEAESRSSGVVGIGYKFSAALALVKRDIYYDILAMMNERGILAMPRVEFEAIFDEKMITEFGG